MQLHLTAQTDTGHGMSRSATEELRALHADLRALAQAVRDDTLREQLLNATRRLAGLGPAQAPTPYASLSPRETDVLAHVALRCSNAETASRLSLRPETVKAYLRSAMRKLDACTRLEAVVAAHHRGLLP
ncbi:response regulator transcription factor [Streptomyces sp. NPDC102384]|uniref:helix-turn-helix transcriptional regulator n=1 Tax=Streptomyces sp. NPDC102384 TaxID=3366166 RepID=UPI0038207861